MINKLLAIILTFMFACMGYEVSLAEPVSPGTQVTVLMYHHFKEVVDPKVYDVVMTPQNFRDQMQYLKDNRFNSITLQELADFLYNDGFIPEKSVLITFDDGYESNYTTAFPTLKQDGFHAVIFPIGNILRAMDEPPISTCYSQMLTASEIQEMQQSGLIEFGSHTYAMHQYVGGAPLLRTSSTEAIAADLTQEEAVFQQIGIPPSTAITYPYGVYNQRAIAAVQQTGLKLAFTIKPGKVTRDSAKFELHRMTVRGDISVSAFAELIK